MNEQIYDIQTTVVRFGAKIPEDLDIPNTKIYIIGVTDPQNRYLETPRKTPWIETYPLQIDYFCGEDELEEALNFFRTNNCSFGYKSLIVPEHKYEKRLVTDNIENIIEKLYKEDSTNFRFRYVLKDLENPKSQTLIPVKSVFLPRFADAYFNFKNISSIKTIYEQYNPLDFTSSEHALFLNSWLEYRIEAEDPTLPVEFNGVYYSHELRRKYQNQSDFNSRKNDILIVKKTDSKLHRLIID